MANVVSGHILAVYPHTFDLSIRPMRVGGKAIEGDSFAAPDSAGGWGVLCLECC